jgi:hypothetical protein
MKDPVRIRVASVSVLALILLGSALPQASSAGQKRAIAENETPVFSDYRGVQIGMTAATAREKLGKPKDTGDTQDYFAFGENEAATIVYDAAQHKVVTLSIDYASGATGIPLAKAVVGSEIEAKPDGSIYKMVRYPKAGYWVSYFKAAGDSPTTSITIQKIE